MTWHLYVPCRDPDERLTGTAIDELSRALDGEERLIARELLLGARLRGAERVGDLVHHARQASPGERRRLLDEARRGVGLPEIASVDARRAHETRQQAIAGRPERDGDGRAYQRCHAEGCTAVPIGATGMQEPRPERRWFCEGHRDLAAPGDLEPWSMGLRYSPSGAIVFAADAAADAERERSERDAEHAERAERRRQREAEADDLRRHERALAERFTPSGAGWEAGP